MQRTVPLTFEPLHIDDDVLVDALCEADEAPFLALIAAERERLQRWLPFAATVSTSKRFARHLACARAAERAGLGCDLAVRVDGRLAGSVQVHHVDPFNDLADLGYWLGAGVARRGVMTRVLPAVAAFAFRAYRIHRLQLITHVDNLPSRTIAERAGFVRESTLRERFRVPGGYSDGLLYVKFAADVWTPSIASTSTTA